MKICLRLLCMIRRTRKWAVVLMLGAGLCTQRAEAQSWIAAYGFGSSITAELGRAVCTDASGNSYYIGNFRGGPLDFNPGGGVTNLTSAGSSDMILSKYDASGAFQWAVRAGGAGLDGGAGVAADASFVYITGTFNGTATFGSIPLTTTGSTDVFVAKLDVATGNFIWATKMGGTGGEDASGICIDASGNSYIIGRYNVSITFTGPGNTLTATGGSNNDVFIAKLNSSGAIQWGTGGGASAASENGAGASICYVPGLNELVVTGSYNDANATFGGVTLTNTGYSDIFLLEMNAVDGTFQSGMSVGSTFNSGAGTGSDESVAVCYDAFTQDVFLSGYFDGATVDFGGDVTLTNGGDDDIFVARYDPATNAFLWAVKPSAGGAEDRGYGIGSNGTGMIYLTGQYEGTTTFGSTSLTAASVGFSDIFVAGLSATDGAWQFALSGGSNDVSTDEIGRGIAAGGPQGKISIAGSFAGAATFGANSFSSAGGTDILFAQLSSPVTATISGTDATCVNGCNGSATVVPSGGVTPYTYSWSPSGGTAATATGLCIGSYNVTITDNIGASIIKNVVIGLPTTQLATATTNNTAFPTNANNTNIYDAACNLITTLVPNGGSPVTGNVSARVWKEPGVPVYLGQPYVARHYEITPATGAVTATGRVTLYFTQAEFDAFNAAPGSTLNLPTEAADATGKSNLRITKFAGSTSNPATGLPGTYAGAATLIDPVDVDIIYNSTDARWEVSFNVVGFSGFFVQTYQAALPVTWISINATLNAQGQASITWKVQEQQVANYTIEKSVNSQGYVAIGTVASIGEGEHAYSFGETDALSGAASYRIRQTDADGRYTYSKVLLLRSDKGGWVVLYPNPVKASAVLNVTDRTLLKTTAHLYDATGREVKRILITQTVTSISMAGLNTGTYTLKLQDGKAIKIMKE